MGNPKWRYKLMTKAKIDEIVQKDWASLCVEVYHQSKPGYHLQVAVKDKGLVTIGRVPKNIFTWYELIPMEKQPGFINITLYKFRVPNEESESLTKEGEK